MLNLEKSSAAFAEAKTLMPGGVNSPVRSFARVACDPPFIDHAKGSKIYDIDGNEYIDYVGSWGPMIVGHAHPDVVKAIQEAAQRGTSYGAPTLLESQLAKKVMELMPSIEKIRMVNSGTEATMSALRVARGYTRRDKIVKFIGCYHGHGDSLLVKAGSGAATFGQPDSPGVTAGTAKDTLTVPYNDVEAFTNLMNTYGDEIAAVIVEPVAGNMGLVLPKQGFLSTLRQETQKHGTVLIFDEVMCGFRVALNGAQAAYGIVPDMTCLGKIIGGGLPVAAYGGKREIMDCVSPIGPVYQAGTLSGNPLAMTAGLATLNIISAEPSWGKADYTRELTIKTKHLLQGIAKAAKDADVKIQIHQAGSMFGIFFNENDVYDYATSEKSNQEAFGVWFMEMLNQGIYLAPSQFETLFMSGAHSDDDIVKTIDAAEIAMQKVAQFLQKQ
ncbi:glutamate-1-semialdehyde 2,1-aminomutase [Megamonas hypermegale]|uniref:glutamate-1-semialdehyde 2,1-aminomutase n=1 Tax=Megamonas hypermegale TaxID=158847 RepID=UPI0019597656|nr:glutamate-1-semialdehyde 2,1-aminomutase [Megamonas hypermegale]MBM6832735.1 glutamate-1-semialdehyde 2,1-aminomutase [Megamonas hypermegale]